MRKQTKSAVSQQIDKAMEQRLKSLRKSALVLGKVEGLIFVRDTAGYIFDQTYEPVEALNIEVESSRKALKKLEDRLKEEEQKLAEMDEYLSSPPEEEKEDEK